MTIETFAALADLISAIAVLATLLFLLYEMRQNTKAIKAQSMYASNEAFNSINLVVGSSPEQAQLYLEGSADFNGMSLEKQVQFSFMVMSVFRVFETIYLQVQSGIAEPRLWEAEQKSVRHLLGLPGVRQWWTQNPLSFSNEFCAMIDDLIASINQAA